MRMILIYFKIPVLFTEACGFMWSTAPRQARAHGNGMALRGAG